MELEEKQRIIALCHQQSATANKIIEIINSQ